MRKATNLHQNTGASLLNSPRITVIGCGAIAEAYYLPALAKQPGIMKSLTLVDQNPERVQTLARTFGVDKCLTDYRQALDSTDGVIVALPTHLHNTVAMEFLSRGLPVFCEKPLAESSDKARAMVEMAVKMKAALATNYSQRLWPQFAKVKELTEDRSLGRPTHIKYYVGEVFKWPTVSGFYFNSAAPGRGILRDRGAHVFDHICWWLGAKPEVLISQNDAFGGSEAVAYVEFKHNECVGEVKLSWLSSFPCKFLVEFENGSIEGEVSYPQSVIVRTGKNAAKRVNLKAESYMALGNKMVSNFVKVVAGHERPLISGSDVLDSISFIDECYAGATRFEMPWYTFPEVAHE